MPQTPADLVKAFCRRWGDEFAKPPAMPSIGWRAVVQEWPQLTAEPAPSGACDRIRVELGGAWTSSKSHRAVSGSGRPCSSS